MAKQADVIDFRQHQRPQATIVRLIPELDGLEMLYSNDNTDQVFSLKVLCWALWSDGKVDGLVPWLNTLAPCRSLKDPLNGHWEGFIDPHTGQILFDIPSFKHEYLKGCAAFYPNELTTPCHVIQEFTDTIGSHAVFTSNQFDSFTIQEIHSWRLYGDGSVLAMCVEEDHIHDTPVLPGDDCLYSVQHKKDFQYFFQYSIANKIKSKDPAALAAMAHLAHH